MILREQVGTGLREPHEGPAFMQFEPAEGNRTVEARGIFSRCALVAEQERRVDLFDVDAPLLLRLEARAWSIRRRAALSGSAKGRLAVHFIAAVPALLGPAAHTCARSNRAVRATPRNRLRCA